MKRMASFSGEPRYWYDGYVIARQTRDWAWPRGATGWEPKVMWEVHVSGRTHGRTKYFRTRREAMAWVDAQ